MGRNETTCLRNISCDSMEQQTMKVRPALLKRKNFDSSELLNHSSHRRNKSQQVRFKEDTTNTNPSGNTGLDSKSSEHTQIINGKTEKYQSRSLCAFSYPKSQKGLHTIAVQTSPSLRKPFPVIKERITNAAKHLKESSGESSFVQFNGDFSDEDLATQLSHLIKGEKLEGSKGFRKKCLLRQTLSKAQNNGPFNDCSGMEFAETFERATVSIQVPDISIESTPQEIEESRLNLQTDHTLQASVEYPDKSIIYCTRSSDSVLCSNKQKNEQTQEHFHPLTQDEAEELKPNIDSKRIITLTPSLNSNLAYCFHSEHRAEKILKVLEGVSPLDYSQTMATFDQGAKLQDETVSETKLEDNTTQQESSKCSGGAEQSHCFPRNETHYKVRDESKEGNPGGHKAHGEFCKLQGKLKSIEESLQSNQEKIKILLNVIQDLEKARAFSEGRCSYRTGQDLNNCSTCQSTACIIYSVEYDFRQQEGRFHQVLKELDKAEPSPILANIQKTETDNIILEKQDIRKKAKKVKKKCFWWI